MLCCLPVWWIKIIGEKGREATIEPPLPSSICQNPQPTPLLMDDNGEIKGANLQSLRGVDLMGNVLTSSKNCSILFSNGQEDNSGNFIENADPYGACNNYCVKGGAGVTPTLENGKQFGNFCSVCCVEEGGLSLAIHSHSPAAPTVQPQVPTSAPESEWRQRTDITTSDQDECNVRANMQVGRISDSTACSQICASNPQSSLFQTYCTDCCTNSPAPVPPPPPPPSPCPGLTLPGGIHPPIRGNTRTNVYPTSPGSAPQSHCERPIGLTQIRGAYDKYTIYDSTRHEITVLNCGYNQQTLDGKCQTKCGEDGRGLDLGSMDILGNFCSQCCIEDSSGDNR